MTTGYTSHHRPNPLTTLVYVVVEGHRGEKWRREWRDIDHIPVPGDNVNVPVIGYSAVRDRLWVEDTAADHVYVLIRLAVPADSPAELAANGWEQWA